MARCRSPGAGNAGDHEFVVFLGALNGFETIDGRAFVGNTPIFRARLGQTVQWDVLNLGDEFHTFHVHGTAGGAPRRERGHADDRPGRELRRALEGGPPRDLAVPLPRRVAHDDGDDRHLPGDG